MTHDNVVQLTKRREAAQLLGAVCEMSVGTLHRAYTSAKDHVIPPDQKALLRKLGGIQ